MNKKYFFFLEKKKIKIVKEIISCMKDKQNENFFRPEADNYYKRKKNDLLSLKAEKDVPLRILDRYKIIPKKVLEIGCMNGYRLNFINNKYYSECIGIEPSKEAVNEGNK